MDSGIELMSENSATIDGSFLTDTWEYTRGRAGGVRGMRVWAERGKKAGKEGRSAEHGDKQKNTVKNWMSAEKGNLNRDRLTKLTGNWMNKEGEKKGIREQRNDGERQKKPARERTNVEDWKIRGRKESADQRMNKAGGKDREKRGEGGRISVEVEMQNLKLNQNMTERKKEEKTALKGTKYFILKIISCFMAKLVKMVKRCTLLVPFEVL